MDRDSGSARGLVLAGLWGTLPASSCDACCLLATVGGVNSGGAARIRLDSLSDRSHRGPGHGHGGVEEDVLQRKSQKGKVQTQCLGLVSRECLAGSEQPSILRSAEWRRDGGREGEDFFILDQLPGRVMRTSQSMAQQRVY